MNLLQYVNDRRITASNARQTNPTLHKTAAQMALVIGTKLITFEWLREKSAASIDFQIMQPPVTQKQVTAGAIGQARRIESRANRCFTSGGCPGIGLKVHKKAGASVIALADSCGFNLTAQCRIAGFPSYPLQYVAINFFHFLWLLFTRLSRDFVKDTSSFFGADHFCDHALRLILSANIINPAIVKLLYDLRLVGV